MNQSATYTVRKDLLVSKADMNSQTSQRSSLYVCPYCVGASLRYTTIYRAILLLERIYRFAPHHVLDKDEFHVSTQNGPDTLRKRQGATAACNGNLVGHELTCVANACYLDSIFAVGDDELWPGQKKTRWLHRPNVAPVHARPAAPVGAEAEK
ncbi:hypothetical protein COCC4DRAFT_136110 [Bipolaris maydis ATCC 48331]|uniref:Uncharacterized protein n=2 Tax=Cochliobolus heterostrophus TaxID=5016 RepID=M2UB04_COCH5|nr:uncharacterized protein COCC4DRAFT_136110 [Bipolaris maydis ATCC 48331]EMD90856.1 hypothetical protein COCHEDRAFT_1156212 [Bipolaris maydis C5]ENI06058.1 hypothetical protein COCC4DRAFT_136110 [Bipolaris maydis ATCC 48331]